MKERDRYTISEIGIPSAVLMERAAYAAAEEVLRQLNGNEPRPRVRRSNRVVIACGSGNNGGDGYACARILCLRGTDVSVLEAGNPDHMTEETRRQREICIRLGISLNEPEEAERLLSRADAAVDALFGIGLSRDVSGKYAELIRAFNDSGVPVISVDIPSGINADTGRVMGCAVMAAATVTMQCEKPGLLLYPGRIYTGRLIRADIGVISGAGSSGFNDDNVSADPLLYTLEDEDILRMIPERDASGHKGSFGKVLLAAGSFGMAGAAYLSAKAVLRSGAGMVKILTDSKNREILQELVPEALLSLYENPEEAEELLEKELLWCDVCAAGPGMGTGKCAEAVVKKLFSAKRGVPCVLDADGINVLRGDLSLLKSYEGDLFITPHIVEMSRLTGIPAGRITENPVGTASSLAKETGVTCVLKGACTVTACPDGRIFLNTTGNDGMATAGSGDVLTGILAALIARGTSPADAAVCAVYLHGAAGDAARIRRGASGMTASEIADAVSSVLEEAGR